MLRVDSGAVLATRLKLLDSGDERGTVLTLPCCFEALHIELL